MASHESLDAAQQQDAAIRRRAADSPAPEAATGPASHPLLALQRQVGNAAISRMIAQRAGAPEEEEAVQAKHDVAQRAEDEEETVQAKHDVAQRAEDEEEGAIQAKHDVAQRAEDEEETVQAKHDVAQRAEDEEEGAIQAKPEVGLEGGPVSDGLASQINAQRGGGAPLPDAQREHMEGAFGTSFKDVRVHTGDESDALNHSISAKAFTTGSDIFLGKNASAGDADLMGHELTHVVQQRSMSGGGGGMSVGAAGDSYEQQADTMAAQVRSAPSGNGASLDAGAQSAGAEGVQREAAPEEEEQKAG
jgi:hypothetical protein